MPQTTRESQTSESRPPESRTTPTGCVRVHVSLPTDKHELLQRLAAGRFAAGGSGSPQSYSQVVGAALRFFAEGRSRGLAAESGEMMPGAVVANVVADTAFAPGSPKASMGAARRRSRGRAT